MVEVEQSRVTTAQRGRKYLRSEYTLLTGAVLFGKTAAAGGTSPLFDLFHSLCGLDTVTPRKPFGLQLGLGRDTISQPILNMTCPRQNPHTHTL